MNTHNFKIQKKKPGSHAFTLVEIMFVVTIFGIVGAGLTSLIIDASRSMLWTVNKSKITNDVRLFTLKINNEAVNANYAYLYSNFNQGSDQKDIDASGDCLMLAYIEFPVSDTLGDDPPPPYYERIIVYYRSADTEGYSPVFRAEAVFPEGTFLTSAYGENDEDGFDAFLTEQFNSFGDAEEVLQLSKGLTDNQLFRVIGNHTIVINGEIIHGENVQQITNTFNLTISTRG